jgi:hypothetical protein
MRVGIPAVLFGALDVVLVRRGGRTLAAAVMAGVLLGAFIAVALVLMDRARQARRAAAGPRSGSWSNPSRGQRFAQRLRGLTGARHRR